MSVGSFLRGMLERMAGKFYEGPPVPVRFAETVQAFACANKHATREDWARFATRLAAGAYRDGFVRGYEWTARDLDAFHPQSPERVEEQTRSDFPWHAPEHLTSTELAEVVTGDFLESLTPAQQVSYLDLLGRYQGNFRVVALPPEKPAPPAP